jgi:phage-related minor tail protein
VVRSLRRGWITNKPDKRRKAIMKKLKADLKAVTKGLRELSRETEAMAKKVARLEKAQAAAKRKTKVRAKATKKVRAKKKAVAKRKAPARRKATKLTATDQVLNIIKRSKKGVDPQTLMKKAGLADKTVRNILFKASKQRKIKRAGRGVYVAA